MLQSCIVVRRAFLLGLVALPVSCATRNVVYRRRSSLGVPRDAPLWLWSVESVETSYDDESLAALESHLLRMLARDGATVEPGLPPSDGWSIAIHVAGLPVHPSDVTLPTEHSLRASAVVVLRCGTMVTDVIEIHEEVRTYLADRMPWRLARRIADVIAARRRAA